MLGLTQKAPWRGKETALQSRRFAPLKGHPGRGRGPLLGDQRGWGVARALCIPCGASGGSTASINMRSTAALGRSGSRDNLMSNAAATSMDPSGGGGPNNEHGHAGDQFRFEDRIFRFFVIIQTRQNKLRNMLKKKTGKTSPIKWRSYPNFSIGGIFGMKIS